MSKQQLSSADREMLLSRVSSLRSGANKPAEGARNIATTSKYTDFATLPGYDELRLQRSIGDKLGLTNPYFRIHEGRNGTRIVIDGKEVINFSTYDYLGLNGHPEILETAKCAMDLYGVSASASRHVAGECPLHRALEARLASHYKADDALVFVSGYATNVSVIAQLVGSKDLVISDSAVHNSAVMGTVLSGAARRNFAHNDLEGLERLLRTARHQFERVLIVVEGLYSMDGDYPDLRKLVEIKNRYHAWLMVDEAHSLGVLGRNGFGIFEHFEVDPNDIDIWMGTLSKTLSGCGGYIAGSAILIDYLRCMAGAFVYSVGMPPLIAGAVDKALEIMHREPERVARLRDNSRFFFEEAKRLNFDTGNGQGTAVCPIVIGDSIPTVMLSQRLLERGVNVLPVLYPAVPIKSSRLRFFLTSQHTEADMRAALNIVSEELRELPNRIAQITSRAS